MDYKAIYDRLMNFRNQNVPAGYTEVHHILPRSLGGTDDSSNLVRLTAREHYIAHLLLTKFNPSSQTIFALWMMQCGSRKNDRPSITSSKMYEWARQKFKLYQSLIDRSGERNPAFGSRWICNIELKENRKISKDKPIPDGWVAGRNIWVLIEKRNSRKSKNRVIRESRLQASLILRKKKALYHMRVFCSGAFDSVSDYCRKTKCDQKEISNLFLSLNWIKHNSIRRKRLRSTSVNFAEVEKLEDSQVLEA